MVKPKAKVTALGLGNEAVPSGYWASDEDMDMDFELDVGFDDVDVSMEHQAQEQEQEVEEEASMYCIGEHIRMGMATVGTPSPSYYEDEGEESYGGRRGRSWGRVGIVPAPLPLPQRLPLPAASIGSYDVRGLRSAFDDDCSEYDEDAYGYGYEKENTPAPSSFPAFPVSSPDQKHGANVMARALSLGVEQQQFGYNLGNLALDRDANKPRRAISGSGWGRR